METLISGNSIALGYRSTPIGTASSFSIPSGERVALIGANGSGKSTLLRAILGERCLIGGEMVVGGKPLSQLHPRDISVLFAYVGQEHVYVSEIRVKDFLKLAALSRTQMFRALPELSQADWDQISVLGITPHLTKPLGALSTGERQRVFLARAVLQRSRCLILDEPTNHLDPPAVTEFWEMLSQIGCETIVSTHDLDFVKRQATWVCVMKHGQVIFSGTPDALWSGEALRAAYGDKWFDAWKRNQTT